MNDHYYQNANGYATFQFKMKADGSMYLCVRSDGARLYTNTLKFIKEFLGEPQEKKQLTLFD